MKHKKTTALSIMILCMLVLSVSVGPMTFATAEPVNIYFNNDRLNSDTEPVIQNGRAYVPLAPLAKALSLSLQWDQNSKSAQLEDGNHSIRLTIGSNNALKNNESFKLEHAPFLKNDRTMVPVRWVSEAFELKIQWDDASRSVLIESPVVSLPAVGSYSSLQQLVTQHYEENGGQVFRPEMKMLAESESTADMAADGGSDASSDDSVSNTNVQVEGVDEADIVKTDGAYIYQLSQNRLVVTVAKPADQMKLARTIEYKNFQPREMYLDDNHLVVIGSSYQPYMEDKPMTDSEERKLMPFVPQAYTITARIYDVRQGPEQMELVRELDMEGNYISSRKIGPSLYLVTNRYMDMYRIMNEESEVPTPVYRDSAQSAQSQPIDYKDIYYFPGHMDSNYLIVGGVELSQPDQSFEVSAYLGGGQQIYSSTKHLYAAVTQYDYPAAVDDPAVQADDAISSDEGEVSSQDAMMTDEPAAAPSPDLPVDAPESAEPAEQAAEEEAVDPVPSPKPVIDIMPVEPPKTTTKIYKFALQQGKISYRGEGEVPGTVLNQFSMDEHNGYFRIATTSGQMWRNDENTSKNNLYVLNQNLKQVGVLEDLAPGERIYSARYMGERAYMVTYRTVDPLYVIDLHEPTRPSLLGELKIPGFSNYLHPFDENHVIGVGKNTVEVEQKDREGNIIGTAAFDIGMKLSMFDVSDVTRPIEKHVELIGDRGTSSEVLYNHKALLYSREKSMMAFPVTVMTAKDGAVNDWNPEIPAYGQFAFQGAYVYDISAENGFSLRGSITHLSDEMLEKAGDHWYQSDLNIQRILYIGDSLYTLSPRMIKANQLQTLEEQGRLQLPK